MAHAERPPPGAATTALKPAAGTCTSGNRAHALGAGIGVRMRLHALGALMQRGVR